MAFTPLPTDYTDATWDGLKKYNQIDNPDGTVSFQDLTVYTNKEKSFFGARDANAMNEALNTTMELVENGTELLKVDNLPVITAPASSYKIPIQGGSGLNSITYANLTKPLLDKITPLSSDNAGAHNAIYRGKYLGTAVTSAQYTAISSGKFTDLYIGDYWTISGVNYRIAAFDYYYNTGDTACTTHHAVIVPDSILYNAQMNSSESTNAGYVGSTMYKTGLNSAKSTIKAAFSGHVLKHRVLLVNAVSNGLASAGAWCDEEVNLMNEEMVWGTLNQKPVSSGTAVVYNYRVEKSQLPLFFFNPSLISIPSRVWWLRDVYTVRGWGCISDCGATYYKASTDSNGVRPSFCIS